MGKSTTNGPFSMAMLNNLRKKTKVWAVSKVDPLHSPFKGTCNHESFARSETVD